MKVQFLFESEQESAEREAVMDCHLYRGITGALETSDVIRIPIRSDRRPRNASYSDQIIFNAFFEMVYGIKDIRSRAMFCTTEFKDAAPYARDDSGPSGGSVVRVFPLKSSEIAYTPGVPDSLDLVESIGETFLAAIRHLAVIDPDEEKISKYRQLIGVLNNGDVVNCLEQLNRVINSLNTLIGDNEKGQIRLKEALDECKDALKHYHIESATALSHIGSNGVEIMVFNAPYFYAQLITEDNLFSDDDFIGTTR